MDIHTFSHFVAGERPEFSGTGRIAVWDCPCGKGWRVEIQDENGQKAGCELHFPSQEVALGAARSFLDECVRGGVYVVGSEPQTSNPNDLPN